MTNFDYIKLLTPEEFTAWVYDFWLGREQYKYNNSWDALVEFLKAPLTLNTSDHWDAIRERLMKYGG